MTNVPIVSWTARASVPPGPGRAAAGPTQAMRPSLAATAPASIRPSPSPRMVATVPPVQSESHIVTLLPRAGVVRILQ